MLWCHASCPTQATSTSSLHGARTPDLACAQRVGSRSRASLEAPHSSSGSALQEALAAPDPAAREPPSTRAGDSHGSAKPGAAAGSCGAGAERAPAVEAGAPGRGGASAAQVPLRTPYVDLCELPWAGEEAERVRGGSADAPETVQYVAVPPHIGCSTAPATPAFCACRVTCGQGHGSVEPTLECPSPCMPSFNKYNWPEAAGARAQVQEPQESAADAAARREFVGRLAERRSSSMGLAEIAPACARPQLSRKSRSLGAARGPNPFADIRDRIARPRCAGTA